MFKYTFSDTDCPVGSGKSMDLANDLKKCCERAVKIHKKYKTPLRKQLCNFHVSKEFSDKYPDQIIPWHNPLDMIFEDYPAMKVIRRDFDCFWDEIATELPSDSWKDTHLEVRKFFARHRKRGVEIYANTQDYMMLDVNARRMGTEVYKVIKLIGSKDISATLPPVKNPWGIILKWRVKKKSIEIDSKDYELRSKIPAGILFIQKSLIDLYDTTEEFDKSDYDDLQHIEKRCKICGHVKVSHR